LARTGNILKQAFNIRFYLSFFVFIVIGGFFLSTAFAKEIKQVGKDTDGDGKIDRIAFFDAKDKIARLENDSNNDGLMDRFQYYKDEILIRLERDTDFDQQIDCIDYFKDEKRLRQKKLTSQKKTKSLKEKSQKLKKR